MSQVSKPLWTPEGLGSRAASKASGVRMRGTPSGRKAVSCSGGTLWAIPFIFYSVRCWQCPRMDGWLPHRPCTSRVFKGNLVQLGSMGRLIQLCLWGSFPEISVGLYKCQCSCTCVSLYRSLPDQRALTLVLPVAV